MTDLELDSGSMSETGSIQNFGVKITIKNKWCIERNWLCQSSIKISLVNIINTDNLMSKIGWNLYTDSFVNFISFLQLYNECCN